MDLTNLTDNTFVLPAPADSDATVIRPAGDSGDTITVDDDWYAVDDNIATKVNAMVAADLLSVASPPAGFPRITTGLLPPGWTFDGLDGFGVQFLTGGKFTIKDHTGATIFEVRDDGTTHIKTGGSVIADL